MKNNIYGACVTSRAVSRLWRQVATACALCLTALVILGLPVQAHAVTEHVFYASANDEHVRELYYQDGQWLGNDLTADTNGPPCSAPGADECSLTGFFDGSIEHVFYVSSPDYHVRELYNNGAWRGNDLTAATNGPTAPQSLVTSFFDGSIEHVFYFSGDNHVRELYYQNGRWLGNDLTAATNGPMGNSGITSFFDGSVEHVFYFSFDGHVRELYHNGRWFGNDLTANTDGPSANNYALTSFFDGSVEHVFYTSVDDYHVRELYYNGAWWGNDLTADTNTPPSDWGTLASFFVGSVEHVFYLDACEFCSVGLWELYYNGSWWGNDLGTNPSAYGITGFFDGSIEHVFYTNYGNGHVCELYYQNGQWLGNDLTADTNGPPADREAPMTGFVTP